MNYLNSPLGCEYRVLKCPTPITIRVGDCLKSVGCGTCEYCRAALRLVWNFRLNLCQESSLVTYFATLTYSDDNLSSYFDKKYIQKFHKRLRKCLSSSGLSFKFYLISEYGSITHRPHLHALYFLHAVDTDISPVDFASLVDRQWRLGFTLVTSVTSARINYITHYHVRPKFPAPLSKKTHKKPFVMCSNDLSTISFNDIVFSDDGFPMIYDKFNSHWIVVPSYHRRKLGIVLPDMPDAAPNRLVNSSADSKYRAYRKRLFHINYNSESF